jgi:hypothetical protein
MSVGSCASNSVSPEAREFYRNAIDVLNAAGIPFLVGGAYALQRYTGIVRNTKDFDLFLRSRDCHRALGEFAARGFRAELTFPHWLGKVYWNDYFVDLIFSSGNGLVEVDDSWFAYSVADEVLGKPARLCPAEEMIRSKAFIMERERYDGADIAHLLHARARTLDWPRLCRRFGPHWRLLLSHLILFGYIYPAERSQIPAEVLQGLLDQLQAEQLELSPAAAICQGTMLSREQYLIDIQHWGYKDARLAPHGNMTIQSVAHWTSSIGTDNPTAPAIIPPQVQGEK